MNHNQRILILSPQAWGHIRVSKHHYAEELAGLGAEVYFLNPPSDIPIQDGMALEVVDEDFGPGRITLIHWNRRTPRTLRFKALPIYKQMIKGEIGRIESMIGAPVDLLMSFEPNNFPDLSAFHARQTLFMPVDPLSFPAQIDCANKSDLIVSISREILANFDAPRFEGRTLLVDHGISKAFEAEAERPAPARTSDAPVQAGFFGNLDRPIVNHRLFAQLASEHPNVQFHFWGPFEADGPFDQALGQFDNVHAHGPLGKADLVEAARKIDVFLLIYGLDKHTYDRSNAHKILEYLCFGKVIVSSEITRYREHDDLLRAPLSGEDEEIPTLFAQTLGELDQANSPELISRRKAYALQYTYRSQLQLIQTELAARKSGKKDKALLA